jgi:hypothetical protein
MARAGASEEVAPLIEEMSRRSPEFAAMWQDKEVRTYGEGVKRLRHSRVGTIAFEYSSFSVDGRPDLAMVVYNPASDEDRDKVRSLLA